MGLIFIATTLYLSLTKAFELWLSIMLRFRPLESPLLFASARSKAHTYDDESIQSAYLQNVRGLEKAGQ
jgi:hypothetical protein